jgi:hypothetical protein
MCVSTLPARRFQSISQEENMIFIIIALVLFIIGIGMFLQKVRLKSKMEGGLGRKVKDSELTSLSAWMDASSSKSVNARGGKQE